MREESFSPAESPRRSRRSVRRRATRPRRARLRDARPRPRRTRTRRRRPAASGTRWRSGQSPTRTPDRPASSSPPGRPTGTSSVAGSRASTPAIVCSSRAASAGRARHRAGVVERARERKDTGGADAAVGRLQADGAAEAGGNSDRAARVAAERERHELRGQSHGRAAARAAGHESLVPGVPARAHQEVDRGDPPREFVRLRLADQDRAGRACPADGLSVDGRDVVGEHRRAVRRPDALRVEQVLDAERHTGKRPDGLAAEVLLLGGPSLRPARARDRAS